MKLYQGTITPISGIGEETTRQNEITADVVASTRNFMCGYNTGYSGIGGVVQDDNHDFDCSIDGNTAHITDGLCFAYGYFGMTEAVDIDFLPPAVEQYHIIYVELNRSVIPNTCEIKVKNNQASQNVSINSFRHDVLSSVKTGVFQLPLWLLKITNQGIQSKKDLRKLRNYIGKVNYSPATFYVRKSLSDGVFCDTQSLGNNEKLVANTYFVDREIQTEINK